MEEGWRNLLRPLLPVFVDGDGGSTRRWQLLAVLLLYSFSSQFLPIEPYLVPYLTSVKHFTNFQVTVDIYPCSVYAQLVFTLLLAPACFYLSYKFVILLGAFTMLATYIIIWGGKTLLSMQIMQVLYGFGMSSRLVFSTYIFNLVAEEEYQSMTSLTTTTSLLSFMLASELGQVLALQEVSYSTFFMITLISGCRILKETWHGRTIQILSLWSAFAYAGFSLIQNYGTNLFDAIDPTSKFNGHILAASQAAGSLGSFSAIYLESFASKNGMLIYVVGSALMATLCMCMGFSATIWVAYLFYVIISGIYQALACLVSVRCSRLLSNGQYILLFSVNSFLGLLFETVLQATVEILGLSVFAQFTSFSGFFLIATGIFVGICFFDSRRNQSTLHSLR